MGRKTRAADAYEVAYVTERLAAYEVDSHPERVEPADGADPELVERAATLLSVLPANQKRETIEGLLAPPESDSGRRAVDALIESAFAVEDHQGRLRRL